MLAKCQLIVGRPSTFGRRLRHHTYEAAQQLLQLSLNQRRLLAEAKARGDAEAEGGAAASDGAEEGSGSDASVVDSEDEGQGPSCGTCSAGSCEGCESSADLF